jgi:integrase
MRASRVTTTDIMAYVSKRRELGRSVSTIAHELERLKRAFNLGRDHSPPKVTQVPKFPKLDRGDPRKGFFSHAEYAALAAELPAYLRPVLLFAYRTGCRKGEILGLRWEQVDLGGRIVRLNPGETKNNEGRVIPLAGELGDMLATLLRERSERWPECRWVFARHGKPIKDFRGAWEQACRRAAVAAPTLWDSAAEQPTRIFHDLRRTAARNMVRAGLSEQVVMRIGGWKTSTVFERYNVTDERDLLAGAERLEQHLANLSESQGQDKAKSMVGENPGPLNR